MKNIEKDIIFNEHTITEDIRMTLEEMRSGNFEKMGYMFATILKTAVEGGPDALFLY